MAWSDVEISSRDLQVGKGHMLTEQVATVRRMGECHLDLGIRRVLEKLDNRYLI